MSESAKPNPSSDLMTRFAAGVMMVAVACTAIYYGGWPFRILVAAAAAVMLAEWNDMHQFPRLWTYFGTGLLILLLLGATQWFYPVDEMDSAITRASFNPAWRGAGLAVVGGAVLGLFSRRVTMFGGFLYLALPAFALIVLDWLWFELVLWAMIVTWATDIFAYFAGRSIGGPKLAPGISPNKTWAGLAGGIIGAGLCGALVALSLDLDPMFLFAGAPMAVIAQGGDLYESWVKRKAGVKDSGTLLPGHGGVLDRLDGLLPVTVATFLLLFCRL